MRELPIYKTVVKTNRTHRNGIKTMQGGKSMTVNFIQTGTTVPHYKTGLRLADLRRSK